MVLENLKYFIIFLSTRRLATVLMEAVKFIPEKEMALFFDSPSTFRDTGNELTIDINVR